MNATVETNIKSVYTFGNGHADGNTTMKDLLGGKGANLAEMSNMGIPVPPGLTITTEMCTAYNKLGKQETMAMIDEQLRKGLANIESIMGTHFGDNSDPCLLSVRSGARKSMPGMMDTVLNVGLNDEAVEGLAVKTGKPRFAWDSYRRFVQMYSNVVLRVPGEAFEEALEKLKTEKGVMLDNQLETNDLKVLVREYKRIVAEHSGKPFPQDPYEQLWNSILAVFESWNTKRATLYRKLNNIPDDWGTAVNVQAMVFGNMGSTSASGVAFTRNAATGERMFNGEYLIDAQGEDVVAGIRTPQQIGHEESLRWAVLAGISEAERKRDYLSLEEYLPEVYKELNTYQQQLENHFKDMQDLEFTIQEGRLWVLQTRNGKRTGAAMVKIGMDMLDEGLITEEELLKRMEPLKLDELLHPIFDLDEERDAYTITRGLPASPGCASGQIVFTPEDAEKWNAEGKPVILCRVETSADDLGGMNAANGILTTRGGMTSHAAVVARGMGKCCISGASSIQVNYNKAQFSAGERLYREGDWISLNGTTGEVLEGQIKTIIPQVSGDFGRLMNIVDKHTRMKVHANADTPESAAIARDFGAEGIGLCRTEHMFFQPERILAMREMILAEDEEGRRAALKKLLPMQRQDFLGILEAMQGYPVTIRLLDPPLHEFLPADEESQREIASELGVSLKQIRQKIEVLKEVNPMLGHRGCRLGNTYPEISEMQVRAIMEAAIELTDRGVRVFPEIMIPLTGAVNELVYQKHIIEAEVERIFKESGKKVSYKIGTMIEIPRAALLAEQLAMHVDFFSFGTNDLTQMTFGYSRDDAAKFLPIYLEKGLLKVDPFEVLDQEGVGQLVKMGLKDGKRGNKGLVVGICGEHGGEPSSVEFCNRIGMDYVSCSPYRVPIARLAAAQAAVINT